MEANKSNHYLKLMGIDTYVSRRAIPIDSERASPAQNAVVDMSVEDKPESVPKADAEPPTLAHDYPLLSWLKGPSQNGLLVVFAANQPTQAAEQRMLLSNMLKAIQFQPQETGYAVVSQTQSDDNVSLEGLKGILVLGKAAGDQMVINCGARKVPGEEYFKLNNIPVVVTLHPSEILETPALKARAWSDLKLFARLLF